MALGSAPELVEVALDIELPQLASDIQFEFNRDLKASFRKAARLAVGGEHLQQVYSITSSNNTVSGLIKFPKQFLQETLKRSGANGVYMKEKYRPGKDISLAVAMIHSSHLKEDYTKAFTRATSNAHFLGVHRSATGSKSLRFQPDNIAAARKEFAKDDLYEDFNIDMVPKTFYQVQGFPSGLSAHTVASAMKEWGWNVLPIKQWSLTPGMICWLVGSVADPPGEYIAVQDFMVTVVPDKNMPVKRAPAMTPHDAWSSFRRTTSPRPVSSTAVVPQAPGAAPRVQQVVADRIQSTETEILTKVQEITSTLKSQVQTEILALQKRQSSAEAN